MGSGYNGSLSAGRGARRNASTRTAIHFWLDVPYYEYELPCGINGDHTYLSRTPVTARAIDDGIDYVDIEDFCVVWCDRCMNWSVIDDPYPEPLNRPTSTDEITAFEQDKGLIRERIAIELQNRGLMTTEEQFAKAAVEFGVNVAELRRINAGLVAPASTDNEPIMCKAGLHELTVDNTYVNGQGRRGCKACKAKAQRDRRANKKR